MRNESILTEQAEKIQTPEELKTILEQALKDGLHVDLVIVDSSGASIQVSDLIVAEFNGDGLMMTYLAEDGDFGESIPLDFSRIRKASLADIGKK